MKKFLVLFILLTFFLSAGETYSSSYSVIAEDKRYAGTGSSGHYVVIGRSAGGSRNNRLIRCCYPSSDLEAVAVYPSGKTGPCSKAKDTAASYGSGKAPYTSRQAFHRRPARKKTEFYGSGREIYRNYRQAIDLASARYGFDKALISAVIKVESNGNPLAVSRKGARGLMQLIPATAKELGVRDPFDPKENILGGARYLRQQYDRFDRLDAALYAYNAGPDNAEKKLAQGGDFSRIKYVKAVIKAYLQFK